MNHRLIDWYKQLTKTVSTNSCTAEPSLNSLELAPIQK